jgi:hypothetical protein
MGMTMQPGGLRMTLRLRRPQAQTERSGQA